MNRFGKFVFVATALAPCAWAYSVNLFAHGENELAWLWLGIGFGLFVICWLMLEGVKRFHQRQPLTTKKVKLADKEILAFLLAYLLPLAANVHVGFRGDILTAIFVYGVIALCVLHSNAFTFNPLLAILGYHFYEVEGDMGMTFLLLTRRTLHACESTFTVVQFGEYIFVETGD